MRVRWKRHVFGGDVDTWEVEDGKTIAEVANQLELPENHQIRAEIEGVEVNPQYYSTIRPKRELTLFCVPQGGDEGVLKTVLGVVLVVVGAVLSTTGLGAVLGRALIQVGLGMAISGVGQLIAGQPPVHQALQAEQDPSPRTFGITGSHNRANQFGPCPRVFGEMKVYPPLAAVPYTEISGGEQFLVQLFDFGPGPLSLFDLRIGNRRVAEYHDIEVDIVNGWPGERSIRLYRNTVSVQSLSDVLSQTAGEKLYTTAVDTDEAVLDMVFTRGLVDIQDDGTYGQRSVAMTFRYRPAGGGAWSTSSIVGTAKSTAGLSLQSSTTGEVVYRTTAPPTEPVSITLNRSGTYALSKDIKAGTASPNPVFVLSIRDVGETIWQEVDRAYATVMPAGLVPAGEPGESTTQTTLTAASSTGPKASPTTALENMELRVQRLAINAAGAWIPTGSVSVASTSFVAQDSGGTTFTDATASPKLVSVRFRFPSRGQWTVGATRTTADPSSTQIFDEVQSSQLKSIQHSPPVNVTGHCMVAMRIRASEQLNGVIDTFSAVVRSKHRRYVSGAWTGFETTNNPAWMFAEVLKGTATARPLSDSEIDLTQLELWGQFCEDQRLECNGVVDFDTTVGDLLKDIAGTGRASPIRRQDGGGYSVAIDEVKNTVVQWFTPRNVISFTGKKVFHTLPEKLKLRFRNREAGYIPDVREVLAPGVVDDGTLVSEEVDLWGVTDPALVYRMGRFYFDSAKLRPEIYTFTVDIEGLIAQQGDRVKLSHDVIAVGLTYGRITDTTYNGSSQLTWFEMDAETVIDNTKSYNAVIRKTSGTGATVALDTPSNGVFDDFNLTTPYVSSVQPQIGDLIIIGEAGLETLDLTVSEIVYDSKLQATLTCLNYTADVFNSDSETIPDYDPKITWPTVERETSPPVVPQFVKIESGRQAITYRPDGSIVPTIRVVLYVPDNSGPLVSHLQLRYRKLGVIGWEETLTKRAISPRFVIEGVEQGVNYVIEARSVSTHNVPSDWVQSIHGSHDWSDYYLPDVDKVYRNGNVLEWVYTATPPGLRGFEVRVTTEFPPVWSEGQKIHAGFAHSPIDVTEWVAGGQKTFMVKAANGAGNESQNTADLTANFGDALVDNVVLTVDEKAKGWLGVKSNCAVSGGNLVTNLAPIKGIYTFEYEPSSSAFGAKLFLYETFDGKQLKIEYRTGMAPAFWTSDGNNFWTSDGNNFWSAGTYTEEYAPFPGSIQSIDNDVIYQFRVTMVPDGATNATLSRLQLIIDVEDKIEYLDDVVIPAGGRRLPVTETFQKIVTVNLTLQDAGGASHVVFYSDKSTAGPYVVVHDRNGNPTTGSVDAILQGY